MRLSRLAFAISFCLLIGAAACGDSDAEQTPDFPTVVSLGDCEFCPGILNTSLSVGENRVVWQLIDADDNPVPDAAINFRYFNLNGDEPEFSSSAESRFVQTETSFIDENNDRTRTVTGEAGVYVTNTAFDQAGNWGAELSIFHGTDEAVTTYRFTVLEDSVEPSIGDPAPPSVQATTATAPIEEIDSSYPTRDQMHTMTVADALQTGKPIIVAFATPAFCTSRTCGPVLDLVVDPLFWRYSQDVAFIHIEPYMLPDLRQANVQNPVPAVLEWRLRTEPWVFVIGRAGEVSGKFEGIVALDEVESVLQEALAAEPAASATAESTP